jgi:hypothetical protein
MSRTSEIRASGTDPVYPASRVQPTLQVGIWQAHWVRMSAVTQGS